MPKSTSASMATSAGNLTFALPAAILIESRKQADQPAATVARGRCGAEPGGDSLTSVAHRRWGGSAFPATRGMGFGGIYTFSIFVMVGPLLFELRTVRCASANNKDAAACRAVSSSPKNAPFLPLLRGSFHPTDHMAPRTRRRFTHAIARSQKRIRSPINSRYGLVAAPAVVRRKTQGQGLGTENSRGPSAPPFGSAPRRTFFRNCAAWKNLRFARRGVWMWRTNCRHLPADHK